MIEKIIANGLSGAALAALDVAIKLGLEHAGWCREQDRVADRYHLERISGSSSQILTDRAIAAADGSLFFIHGQQAFFSAERVRKAALASNKPFLMVDLSQERGFLASQRVAAWIAEHRIGALHVDGEAKDPRGASADGDVAGVLEATFFLTMMETGVTSPLQSIIQQERLSQTTPAVSAPQSMAAAIDHLERSLSLKDKATIANMASEELVSLHFTLGDYINTHFDLFAGNATLLDDCQSSASRNDLEPTDAAAVIIRELWRRLRETYRIRIIK